MPLPLFRRTHRFRRHAGVVNELVFSPDGTLLVSLGTTANFDPNPNETPATSELCVWSMNSHKIIVSLPIEQLWTLFGISVAQVFFSSVIFLHSTTLLVGTTNGLLVQLELTLGLFSKASAAVKISPLSGMIKSNENDVKEVKHLRQSSDPTVLACALYQSTIVFHIPEDSSVESLQVTQTLKLPPLYSSTTPDVDWVIAIHWMKTIGPSALLVAYQNSRIIIWDVKTSSQLRHLLIPAEIIEVSVDPEEKFVVVCNADNFSFENYSLTQGNKIREISREKIDGPGLSLPLMIIPEQSCIAAGSHYGKTYIYFLNKEVPHEVLKMNDPYPVLCVAYTHLSALQKTVLATGCLPGSSTEFADIIIWETPAKKHRHSGLYHFFIPGPRHHKALALITLVATLSVAYVAKHGATNFADINVHFYWQTLLSYLLFMFYKK